MTSRISTAVVALALSTACAAPGATAVAKRRPAPPPTIYGGSTSDDAPFGLQVSKDHRHLVRLLIHAVAACPSGDLAVVSASVPFAAKVPKFTTANTIIGNRLPPSGAFSLHGVAAKDYGARTWLVAEALRGRIHGRTAKGTFQLTVHVIDTTSGQDVETCHADTLRWTAKASRGRIFIGLTASRKPVVLALTPDRLQVADLWFGWTAACQPAGAVIVGDHLSRFSISPAGQFGGAFDAGPYGHPDGSSASFHYEVHGAVSRTSASGTLAATLTQTDATGATTATCALPAEQWKAADR
jgi:hypothetical protein